MDAAKFFEYIHRAPIDRPNRSKSGENPLIIAPHWKAAMLPTVSSAGRRAIVRCSLAAFASLCSFHFMESALVEADAIQAQADRQAPFLTATPAVLADEMRMIGDGSEFDGLRTPQWHGVNASIGNVEIRPVEAKASGVSVAAKPWSIVATGVVGQPLVFSVQALVSPNGAREVGVQKPRSYTVVLERASNLSPAARAEASVNAAPNSPASVAAAPDGVTTVSIPAVAGDRQVAWVYPQRAIRQPDGSWSVALGVGAAPQKDIDAYQSAGARAMATAERQAIPWFAASFLSGGYGLVSALWFGLSVLILRSKASPGKNTPSDPRNGGAGKSRAEALRALGPRVDFSHSRRVGHASPGEAANTAPKHRAGV